MITINQDQDIQQFYKEKILKYISIYIVIAYYSFAVIYYFTLNHLPLVINNFIFGSLALALYFNINKTKNLTVYSNLLYASSFLGLFFINHILGGINSPTIYWFMVLLLTANFTAGYKSTAGWSLFTIIASITHITMSNNKYLDNIVYNLSENQYQILHHLSILGVMIISIFICYAYIKNTSNLVKTIDENRDLQRSLLRILEHDIANPITIIKSNATLISSDSNEKQVNSILSNIKIIQSILKSVQTLDKVHSGKIELTLGKVNLQEIVYEAIEDIKTLLKKKSIKVDIIADLDYNVDSDYSILKNQILKNILTNSIKFSQQNSTITINNEGNTLSITDKGIGIPEDIISKMFSPTKSTNRKGTDGEKGHGFGIPILKTCCDQLNIQTDVESSIKEGSSGTTFRLIFPTQTSNQQIKKAS